MAPLPSCCILCILDKYYLVIDLFGRCLRIAPLTFDSLKHGGNHQRLLTRTFLLFTYYLPPKSGSSQRDTLRGCIINHNIILPGICSEYVSECVFFRPNRVDKHVRSLRPRSEITISQMTIVFFSNFYCTTLRIKKLLSLKCIQFSLFSFHCCDFDFDHARQQSIHGQSWSS